MSASGYAVIAVLVLKWALFAMMLRAVLRSNDGHGA